MVACAHNVSLRSTSLMWERAPASTTRTLEAALDIQLPHCCSAFSCTFPHTLAHVARPYLTLFSPPLSGDGTLRALLSSFITTRRCNENYDGWFDRRASMRLGSEVFTTINDVISMRERLIPNFLFLMAGFCFGACSVRMEGQQLRERSSRLCLH
jgi:hypothetical protein